MIKVVVKRVEEDEFTEIAEREYESDAFIAPEAKQLLELPEEEDRYFVENVVHHLGEDQPAIDLIVRTEEEVLQEVRKQRRQQRKQMKQMQQLKQGLQGGGGGQGGNPFGGGGQGGGGGNGGGSPFSL